MLNLDGAPQQRRLVLHVSDRVRRRYIRCIRQSPQEVLAHGRQPSLHPLKGLALITR